MDREIIHDWEDGAAEPINREYRAYMATLDEPRTIVRMAPRVNWVKVAWRGVATVLAALQWAMAAVYAVWAGVAGYPRGRKR